MIDKAQVFRIVIVNIILGILTCIVKGIQYLILFAWHACTTEVIPNEIMTRNRQMNEKTGILRSYSYWQIIYNLKMPPKM